MGEFRDFDTGRQAPADDALEGGPSFTLRGSTIRCIPDAPPWVRYSLVAASETSNLSVKVATAVEFMRGVIHPDDEISFEDVMRSKRDPVDDDTMLDLFAWLRDQYIGVRPTKRPSGSAGGPPTESPTSEDAADSPASNTEVSVSQSSST